MFKVLLASVDLDLRTLEADQKVICARSARNSNAVARVKARVLNAERAVCPVESVGNDSLVLGSADRSLAQNAELMEKHRAWLLEPC